MIRSKCCKATVRINSENKDATRFYICDECNEPCDLDGGETRGGNGDGENISVYCMEIAKKIS